MVGARFSAKIIKEIENDIENGRLDTKAAAKICNVIIDAHDSFYLPIVFDAREAAVQRLRTGHDPTNRRNRESLQSAWSLQSRVACVAHASAESCESSVAWASFNLFPDRSRTNQVTVLLTWLGTCRRPVYVCRSS